MYKGFWGWSLENIGAGAVETKYTVECIRDKKDWERFCKTEDINLYEKREYDNVAAALTFYLTWFISDQCYDIKLWEQVFVNGEIVLEQMIEPESTLQYSLRMQIDRDMNDRIHVAENRVKELEKKNVFLANLIEKMGVKWNL